MIASLMPQKVPEVRKKLEKGSQVEGNYDRLSLSI
jgi:hypothetical protein